MLGAMRLCVLLLMSCLAACDPVGGLLLHKKTVSTPRPTLDASQPPDATRPPAVADGAAAEPRDAAPPSDASPTIDAAIDAAVADAGPRDPGTLLGNGVVGYYYAAREAELSGSSVSLSDTSCTALVSVSSGFADAVCIEGVGKLSDGRVVQFSDLCSCGYLCPTSVRACFYFENESTHPWGRGKSGRALLPLRSLAVDPDGPLLGKVVYLPALDGQAIEASASSSAFVHDGCLRADDTGDFASLLGFRLFTGDSTQYLNLNGILAADATTELYEGAPHCASLMP